MPSSKASYEEKVTRNLLAASASEDYRYAKREWELSQVFTAPFRCELCGHVIIHNFEIVNTVNQHKLRVGCCCVDNYLTFASHDSHVQTRETVQAAQLQAESEHIRAMSDGSQRDAFAVRMDVIRASAPFSVGDVTEARSKCRNISELLKLEQICAAYRNTGFVDMADWYMVRRINRRQRIRNIASLAMRN